MDNRIEFFKEQYRRKKAKQPTEEKHNYGRKLEAELLAEKFDKINYSYFKRIRKSLPQEEPHKSRKYKFFIQLSEIFQAIKGINQDLYIEAQVYYAYKLARDKSRIKSCPYGWLTGEKAIKRYTDYINVINDIQKTEAITPEKQVLKSLKHSIEFITKKSAELKIKPTDIFNYKSEGAIVPESYIWIANGSITKPFLAISKSYASFYQGLDGDIQSDYPNPANLDAIKKLVLLNNELRKFCVSVIPQEFYPQENPV